MIKVFSEILQLKEEGNVSFKDGSFDEAMTSYQVALDKFGKKLDSNGPQRDCYVALLSNASLIQYKLGHYRRSEEYATKALDIEWGHENVPTVEQ
jgi:tetratricopeptide (TPR) repeat protein